MVDGRLETSALSDGGADPAGTMERLVERARALASSGERRILGIAGTPGAGKSTLTEAIAAVLGDTAVVVGMDAFHLANRELVRLGRRERKGAPDTFDVDGYVTLLGRLRAQRHGTIYAPVFDRSLEESIGSAVAVPAVVPLVVTEGNYLLLHEHGWGAVRAHLDETWFVDVDPDERRRRLLARRISYGHEPKAAARWVQDVDEANARTVEATRASADLAVHLRSAFSPERLQTDPLQGRVPASTRASSNGGPA